MIRPSWHDITSIHYDFDNTICHQAIAIIVEEEGDIEKFKDYSVSKSSAPTEVKTPSEPSQSKKEEEIPAKAAEPNASKTEEVSHSEDRIFSSPLARKLAEDNNVRHLFY